MLISDLAKETYSAITANKSRSSLTILGIVIGIGSVIAMVSIGQGAQSTIETSIQSIGSNLIMVMPGSQRAGFNSVSSGRGSAQSLTLEDAQAIQKEITTIKAISPEVSKRYQVVQKDKNTNTSVMGVTKDYLTVRNVSVDTGSFISSQNMESYAKVAVIGPTTKTDLFGESDPLNKNIRINGIDFQVIGVTIAKGGSGFTSSDDMIFVPLSTALRFFSGNEYLSTINISAPDQKSLTDVQTQVSELLMKLHKIKNPDLADFSIMNQADIIATASSVTGTFTILLGAIAGISLLVGGIGIMNMMLTTVTERTREIGLRKAIGAKRSDITWQFLTESVMLTFIGGLVGIIFGWLLSLLVSKLFTLNTTVSLQAIILAFGVSAAIGIIFGYYPARRASRLNPIEALRYE